MELPAKLFADEIETWKESLCQDLIEQESKEIPEMSCEFPESNATTEEISALLQNARTIAVVGASSPIRIKTAIW